MTTAISSGIKISVDCQYESRFSNPENNLFMFSYGIKIENKNDYPVQLLRRHWFIYDSNTKSREVEGEGVIGEQPVILPGDSYAYRSSCDFTTDTGKMCGKYQMENLETGSIFDVPVPDFMLIVPHKLN
ncbi:MAG TPA: Co2+/Mg2+ efflux protein ApaG [Cryomorphaceae bacterium]|nr:Co2+/Mg2+ efflux protein ApaG [Cryomorphaceae bacterium]